MMHAHTATASWDPYIVTHARIVLHVKAAEGKAKSVVRCPLSARWIVFTDSVLMTR